MQPTKRFVLVTCKQIQKLQICTSRGLSRSHVITPLASCILRSRSICWLTNSTDMVVWILWLRFCWLHISPLTPGNWEKQKCIFIHRLTLCVYHQFTVPSLYNQMTEVIFIQVDQRYKCTMLWQPLFVRGQLFCQNFWQIAQRLPGN